MRKAVVVLIVGLVILGSVGILMKEVSHESSSGDGPETQEDYGTKAGENWLYGWNYRKSHNITGATGAGTDYQVKVKAMYGSTTVANYTSQAIHLDGWSNAWNTSNDDNFLIVKDGTDYKLHKSTDEGYSYSLQWTPPDGGDLYERFIFVTSSDRLFLNTVGHSSGDTNRLYYSDNGGVSFTQVTDANITNMRFIGFTENTTNGDLFIGRYETANTANIFKSTNDGINWTDISDSTWDDGYTGGARHIHNPEIDPSTGWLYATLGDVDVDGVWRSKLHDGTDWVNKNTTQCTTMVFKDGYVYATSDVDDARIFRFQDDGTGNTQTLETVLNLGAVGRPYIVKDNSARIWAAFYEHGLWTSEDGANWTQREKARSEGNAAFMWGSRNFPSISGLDVHISRIINGYGLRSAFDLNAIVALNENSRNDFGDVRFTSDDGETLLDYWMQEKVDGDYAVFWVKVEDDLSATAQTIYIYYGKDDATTTSDGSDVFTIFDHFDNGVIDNPPWTSSTGASESGTTLTVGDENPDWDNVVSITQSVNKSIETKLNIDWVQPGSASPEGLRFFAANNIISFYGQGGYYRIYLMVGGSVLVDQMIDTDYGTEYHYHSIRWTNDYSFWLIDDTGKGAYNDAPSVDMDVRIRSYSPGNYILADWLFVRNYVYPEPSHGSWGSEDSSRPAAPPTNIMANLSGPQLSDITVRWQLSIDDSPSGNISHYEIHRGFDFDGSGLSYPYLASVPSGVSLFMDQLVGQDEHNYFYVVCAVGILNKSSCTERQAGKFTRPLVQGPNLVSIPLIQSDESIETVLQTVKYDMAWYYDSSSKEWKWHMTSKNYGRGLWSFDHTMGLWVNVTGPSNLTVAGVVPVQTVIHLHKGWNLIGYPSFSTSFTIADLKSTLTVERVEAFDASAPPHFLKVPEDSDVV
ncbi:MAG: DUF2341 domain-containing protein, partial [Thermoplasmata archaeon]|nr:DUF2341 domain-containing protein [Thermoplasmata archaeon]